MFRILLAVFLFATPAPLSAEEAAHVVIHAGPVGGGPAWRGDGRRVQTLPGSSGAPGVTVARGPQSRQTASWQPVSGRAPEIEALLGNLCTVTRADVVDP